MATRQQVEREVKAELKGQGYAVETLLDFSQPKATYYKPDGEALPNLPADPFSMQKYLLKGFTLAPPTAKAEPVVQVMDVDKSGMIESTEPEVHLACEDCGFKAKSAFGLRSHVRKHKREHNGG